MSDIVEKKCNKCGLNKNITEFYYRKNRNRYEPTCNPCLANKLSVLNSQLPLAIAN